MTKKLIATTFLLAAFSAFGQDGTLTPSFSQAARRALAPMFEAYSMRLHQFPDKLQPDNATASLLLAFTFHDVRVRLADAEAQVRTDNDRAAYEMLEHVNQLLNAEGVQSIRACQQELRLAFERQQPPIRSSTSCKGWSEN